MDQFEEHFPQSDAEEISKAKKDMWAGLLWCAGGLLVTYLSYYFASAGSKYIIATGAILYGAFQGIRGLVVYLKMMRRYQEPEKFRRALILGILCIAAVACLAIGGFRLTHKNRITLLNEPQVIADSTAGVSFVIPKGFAKAELSYPSEESDSTFQTADYSSLGQDQALGITLVSNAMLYLSVDYILTDSLNYDLHDTTALNLAVNSVESYGNYFTSIDKDIYETDGLLFDPYYIVLGEKTYYKSSGKMEDGVNAVYYRTFHNCNLVEIRYLYASPNNEQDNQKESWADGFVKNSFHYFDTTP